MASKWSYKDYTDNTETLKANEQREQVASSKPSDFTYSDYVESDTVKAAKDALNAQLAQKPNAYQSQWQNSINDTINKIMNREKFSYDLNGDALYQQYKDQYTTQGKLAMMDTMGQAAAATGGYGNSYAQSVGQQTYQGYLQQLNDKVPELYQLALDQYNREGDDLYNQYGLYSDMESRDYSKYRDTVSDYNTERDYLTSTYYTESDRDYGRYNDAYNKAYGQHRDSVADWQNELNRADSEYWNQKQFGYGQYADNKNLAYQDYRNEITDSQWQKEFDTAVDQWNKNMAYQKERDAVADSQWQKSYNASLNKGGNTTTVETPKEVDPPKAIEQPKPTVSEIEDDLNAFIAGGASKSEINMYIRKAQTEGIISPDTAKKLQLIYAPKGYTY